MANGLCSMCNFEPIEILGPRYCLKCHAAYMRVWRRTHLLTAEQKVKDNARSKANVYKRRGHLKQEPCQTCGDSNSQMHHPDYSQPLKVEWLCRHCHLELHWQAKIEALRASAANAAT